MYFSKLNALLWIAELQSFLRLLKNILQAPQEEEPLFSLPADLTIFPSHHIFYPPVLRSTTLMDIKWKKEIANNLTVKVNSKKLLKCQIISMIIFKCAWYTFLTFSRFLPFINSRIDILWQCSDLFSVSGYIVFSSDIFCESSNICNQCFIPIKDTLPSTALARPKYCLRIKILLKRIVETFVRESAEYAGLQSYHAELETFQFFTQKKGGAKTRHEHHIDI